MRRPELTAQLDPTAVGEPDVEHRHLRCRGGDAAQRLLDRAGLADHLDVALGLEHVADPASHHFVIVDQEHPQC